MTTYLLFRSDDSRPEDWNRSPGPWNLEGGEVYLLEVLAENPVQEVDRLRGLLARLEWTRGPRPRCPACDGWHPNVPGGRGHHPACWLAKELGR